METFAPTEAPANKSEWRHVVARTDVCKMNFREVPEMLLQGEEIRERLAGVLEFAKRVDDWNSGISRHFFNHDMAEGTENDDVDPALKIMRDVIERLAGVETVGGLVEEKCAAAHTVHSGFEGEAGTQRGLLEETSPSACRRGRCENPRGAA